MNWNQVLEVAGLIWIGAMALYLFKEAVNFLFEVDKKRKNKY